MSLRPRRPSAAPVLVEESASDNSTKGAEEQKQEGNDNRRSSPCKKRSKRWDLRGEDERTQKQLRVEVSKVMVQVVRHNYLGQIWFEQQ